MVRVWFRFPCCGSGVQFCGVLSAGSFAHSSCGDSAAGAASVASADESGEAVRGELLYPVYQDNQLVLPAHTVIAEPFVSLKADHAHRVTARFAGGLHAIPHADRPVRLHYRARWDSDSDLDGGGTDGAPIYRVVRTPTHRVA